MAVYTVFTENVCSCCGWTIPADAPAFINDVDYATSRVFCRRCHAEARPIHQQSVCCCCGRTLPAIEPVIINDADYTRRRVFCRRCYAAGPWRDRPRNYFAAGLASEADASRQRLQATGAGPEKNGRHLGRLWETHCGPVDSGNRSAAAPLPARMKEAV